MWPTLAVLPHYFQADIQTHRGRDNCEGCECVLFTAYNRVRTRQLSLTPIYLQRVPSAPRTGAQLDKFICKLQEFRFLTSWHAVYSRWQCRLVLRFPAPPHSNLTTRSRKCRAPGRSLTLSLSSLVSRSPSSSSFVCINNRA